MPFEAPHIMQPNSTLCAAYGSLAMALDERVSHSTLQRPRDASRHQAGLRVAAFECRGAIEKGAQARHRRRRRGMQEIYLFTACFSTNRGK